MTEVTVKEVTVFKMATFLDEALLQICFLGIYEIFNITKGQHNKSGLPNVI